MLYYSKFHRYGHIWTIRILPNLYIIFLVQPRGLYVFIGFSQSPKNNAARLWTPLGSAAAAPLQRAAVARAARRGRAEIVRTRRGWSLEPLEWGFFFDENGDVAMKHGDSITIGTIVYKCDSIRMKILVWVITLICAQSTPRWSMLMARPVLCMVPEVIAIGLLCEGYAVCGDCFDEWYHGFLWRQHDGLFFSWRLPIFSQWREPLSWRQHCFVEMHARSGSIYI